VPAPLLLADVPWLLYRSYFALPKSIVGADGHPVNALLGTVNALLRLSEAPGGPPRAVISCTGAEEAAYRVKLYPRYHAHRDPMPAELRKQWNEAPALLDALGWTVVTSDSLEADDVMFSLAKIEEDFGGGALLFTGDRDLYGAVSDATAVVELPKKGNPTTIDRVGVEQRYGVPPELVADFIALRGDPSDGLPGAPGIGAKTAAALLREHGSMQTLLETAHARVRGAAHAAAMRPRIAAALVENEAELLAFQKIATLQRVELERPPDRATDRAGGAAAVAALGMKRLAERLSDAA
jgi:5'-3' exonuclease